MDARIVDGRKIARVTDDGKLEVLVHGRDGDNLVPVKVSEDGYLMLATDVTVDLGTVELNQGAPGQNPWPVTLSGTKVELLKEWSDTGLMSQVEWFYGNNRIQDERLLIPVNYSAKPRKMILVSNLFDAAVACRGVWVFKDGTTRGATAGYLPFAEEVLIGANASALLTSETLPELDYNFPGIGLRFMRKGMPTTGTLDIWFFGGDSQ